MTIGRYPPPVTAPARSTTRCWSIPPDFVAACGFANAKAAGYEVDGLLPAAAAEERLGGRVLVASEAAAEEQHNELPT